MDDRWLSVDEVAEYLGVSTGEPVKDTPKEQVRQRIAEAYRTFLAQQRDSNNP